MKIRGICSLILFFSSTISVSAQTEIHHERTENNEIDASKNAGAKKKVRNDYGLKNNDGEAINKKHSIGFKLGPPGFQRGNPNPVGLPPGLGDIEFSYLHPSGLTCSISVIPGLLCGAIYRAGPLLYGGAGTGMVISGQGVGPGVYTELGMNVMRHWPISFDFAARQALGIAFGPGGSHLTLPYSLRMGMGVHF